MQVNEHVGQVKQATRLPDIDQAFENTPAPLETRADWMSSEKPRHPSVRPPTFKPGRYGAGF